MKRFLFQVLLYLLLLTTLILFLLKLNSFIVEKRNFKNHETESNLLVQKKSENYDLLFMGISHARNLSRHKNHIRIENYLNKKIINIGQGEGRCGANEQHFYLNYFYEQNNSAATVVYFISPPMFFSETLPIASNTFNLEPFELSFLLRYIFFDTENKGPRIASYLQEKFKRVWLTQKPFSLDSMDKKLEYLDSIAVAEGQYLIYKDSLNMELFSKSVDRVEETINLALENKSKVILIIPPALMGKWKGHSEVGNFANRMKQLDGVEFYDFSESVLLPEYYYDHHHLNTNGVMYFIKNYFQPLLIN